MNFTAAAASQPMPAIAPTPAHAGRIGRFIARSAFAAGALVAGALVAGAALAKTAPSPDVSLVSLNKSTKRVATPRTSSQNVRATAPVVTVSSTGPGQAGYVHYFVITHPDGETESQVGLELPGDRIAWSFPGRGVFISPFIASGWVSSDGKAYQVEHLYGIRPFPAAQSMRVLQQELAARVAPWVEHEIPYCDEEQPAHQVCFSCLGFVLRVLYPGSDAGLPAFPADFKSARKNMYSTEDLLLYLTGVPVDAAKPARLKRIAALAVPEKMREELVRISGEVDALRASAPKQMVRAAPAVKTRTARPAAIEVPRRATLRRRS